MNEISFTDYWTESSPERKKWLAERLRTSVSQLSQLAHGHKRPSQRFVDLASIVTGERLLFVSCCED